MGEELAKLKAVPEVIRNGTIRLPLAASDLMIYSGKNGDMYCDIKGVYDIVSVSPKWPEYRKKYGGLGISVSCAGVKAVVVPFSNVYDIFADVFSEESLDILKKKVAIYS